MTTPSAPELGWHFLTEGGLLRDGTKPPRNGRWLIYDGEPAICERGLHGSRKALHATPYAQSANICRVQFDGIVAEHEGDKLVCSRRKILWRMDATETLRAFGRRCALDVIHLWEAPDEVRRYLETGDESLRAAAWDAAGAAAWAAAWAAAGDAAWAAAWAAARDAARDAAWAAARAVARAAAWAAAGDAAWYAAWAAKPSMYADWLDEMLEAKHAEIALEEKQ